MFGGHAHADHENHNHAHHVHGNSHMNGNCKKADAVNLENGKSKVLK